ncbi:MAG: CapA family protein [Chloroflexota bacterium]|nr:MAG: CapA family protein [Chloroflexota bacterium]
MPTETIRLALAGDVMLGRTVNEVMHRSGPAYPWGNTIDFLRKADLTVINLECVIAADGVPWSRWPKVFHFRADPVAMESLILAGIDAVTLANNHVLDFEEQAMLELLGRLDDAGIAHCGAAPDLTAAARPALLTRKGITVGIVAFTDNEPGWAAGPSQSGINYVPIRVTDEVLSAVRSAIQVARLGGANLVVLACHWGPNMRERPTPTFRAFARAVLDAGADVFFGHSAHIIQGIEIYHGKPIIYDAGDFVDDYAVDPYLRNDQSLLFALTVSRDGVVALDLYPVLIDDYQVNFATGPEFESIASRIEALSAEMGTAVERRNGHLGVRDLGKKKGKG